MTPEGAPAQRGDEQARPAGEAAAVLRVAACVAGLAGFVYLLGWIVTWIRFETADLPGQMASVALDDKLLFGAGLRALGVVLLVFALLCGWAYVSAGRKWDLHAQAWHDIVRLGGVGNARDDDAAREHREKLEAHVTWVRKCRYVSRVAAVARAAGRLNLKAVERRLAGHAEKKASAARRPPTADLPGPEADATGAEADPTATPAATTTPPAVVTAALGDRAVRIVAGFNLIVISSTVGLAGARVVEAIEPGAWAAIFAGWAITFVVTHELLTHLGPVFVGPRAHASVWVIIAIAAVLVSVPIGVVLLSGVVIATFGRRVAGLRWPRSTAEVAGSPLVWAGLVGVTLVGTAFYTVPPVSFPRVSVATASGERVGGYLGRTSAGVYLVTCTPLADAKSTDTRVVLVSASDVRATTLGGPQASVDSGARPSVATLVLRAIGFDPHVPTLISLDVRARRATCAGGLPSGLTVGTEDPALGAGAIAGPPPPGGRAQAGEAPIGQTTPAGIARLALRYQPTVEVTVADRNWPVSVGAVLEDRGAGGGLTCLRRQDGTPLLCPPGLGDLKPNLDPDQFLRYPAGLGDNPNAQVQAFARGQHVDTGSVDQWLANPGLLDPWATAQVYFYYAGPASFAGNARVPRWPVSDAQVPSGLLALEYWFFYPFNYYPTVVKSSLMGDAPLAGDVADTDLHQGDWEHVTVLLDPTTRKPVWLYTARHSDEGEFIPWTSTRLTFDQGHPILLAAFGGHPTYPNTCARHPRSAHGLHDLVSDWTVCGSGRFAFRAASTPLVDMARTTWACWKGHFGLATPTEIGHAKQPESSLQRAINSNYLVAGPRSPLWQAENGHVAADGMPAKDYGVCDGGPTQAENAAAKAGL